MADVLIPLGDGSSKIRFKDMGDGTVAEVVTAAFSSAPTTGDKLIDIGNGVSKKRLRDMGDGTVAEVFYGA